LAQAQTPALTLEELCREAVVRCGDDWPRIERYVAARLRALPRSRRAALLENVSRILRYRPPSDVGTTRDCR
jgi:hypothetical protein